MHTYQIPGLSRATSKEEEHVATAEACELILSGANRLPNFKLDGRRCISDCHKCCEGCEYLHVGSRYWLVSRAEAESGLRLCVSDLAVASAFVFRGYLQRYISLNGLTSVVRDLGLFNLEAAPRLVC